jgi:hypothetical protein
MTNTLLLDQSLWDLCLDANGNIAVAADPYARAQDVASALRLFLGELWYNAPAGVPYFEQILGKNTPLQVIKALFVRAAVSVPGVTSAVCYVSSFEARALTGQVRVTFDDGSTSMVALSGTTGGITAFVGP